MNNVELAKSNLRQASERLKYAREAVENGNYPYTVRQGQEAEELYTREDALEYLEKAEFVVGRVIEFYERLFGGREGSIGSGYSRGRL